VKFPQNFRTGFIGPMWVTEKGVKLPLMAESIGHFCDNLDQERRTWRVEKYD
jgi:hypothetical protein